MKLTRFRIVSGTQRVGLTLVELVVVLAILVALAGLATPRLMSTAVTARQTATHASAVEIRDAVTQLWSDCKYQIEGRRIQLDYVLTDERPDLLLDFDVNAGLGWRGPYLQSDGRRYIVDAASGFTSVYGDASQLAVRDGYVNQDYDGDGNDESGSPFVIQEPTLVNLDSQSLAYTIGEPREVRVVSAGPNGILEIDEANFAAQLDGDPSLKGDDIYVTFVLR